MGPGSGLKVRGPGRGGEGRLGVLKIGISVERKNLCEVSVSTGGSEEGYSSSKKV